MIAYNYEKKNDYMFHENHQQTSKETICPVLPCNTLPSTHIIINNSNSMEIMNNIQECLKNFIDYDFSMIENEFMV